MISDVLTQDLRVSRTITSFLRSLGLDPLDSSDLVYLPLTGGMSKAANYRFDLLQHSYVLRLFAPQSSRLSRHHQILIAQEAGRLGVGPKIHFVDPDLEAFVMDFIPGRTVHPRDFANQDQLIKFAELLRQLHRSSSCLPSACSPFQRFHEFLRKGDEKKCLPEMAAAKCSMEEIEAVVQLFPVSFTPAHLDLNSLNIMLSGDRFFLVDWVNGGMSDSYFDLANFSVFQGLDKAQTETFLTHYFGQAPTSFEWSRFVILKPVRLFVIAAAFLSQAVEEGVFMDKQALILKDFIYQHAEGRTDGHLGSIGLTMLKAGLDLIQGEEFKAALLFLQELASEKWKDTLHSERCPFKAH